MKTKLIAILAVFLVLAIGAVLVNAANASETTATTFESAASGYVTPMAGSCNYFCAACVSLGHNGACTANRGCC